MLLLCIVSFLLLAKTSAGGQTYNPNSHICCNGALLERPNTTEYGFYCCGKKLIIYSNTANKKSNFSICCEGTVYENAKPSSQCCGKTLYNASANACSQYKTVVPISFENKLATTICGKEASNLTAYNPKEQLCCFGMLHKKEKGFRCCNDSVYNVSTGTCCGNAIVSNEKMVGKNCCGNKLYDASKAKCCRFDPNPDLKPRSNWLERTYTAVIVEYNGLIPERAYCCQDKLFDYETQVCCPSGPIEQPIGNNYYQFPYASNCCGKELITNWTQQLCVGGVANGKIVQKSHKNEAACGNEVYDKEKYSCFNNTLIQRKLNQQPCYWNGLYYNITSQICTQHEIIDFNKDDIIKKKLSYCEEITKIFGL